MYLNFYHLVRGPFSITPDPAFLFLSPSHGEALASIIYGVEMHKGIVAVTGEVGTGKTTIVRACLEHLDPKRVKVVYIFDPDLSFHDLLRDCFKELDLKPESDELHAMVKQFHYYLIDQYSKGQTIVLVIDEAQNSPVTTLESMRLLSNLETSEDKLLQIVLVGQPELDEKLNRTELRQLKQRIAVRATIQPLTPTESRECILYRLAQATPEGNQVFSSRALNRIVQHAQGIPRVMNILCDNALIAGFGYEKRPITLRIVKEVIADYEREGEPERRPVWRTLLVASMAVLIVAAGVGAYLHARPDWKWSNLKWESVKSIDFSKVRLPDWSWLSSASGRFGNPRAKPNRSGSSAIAAPLPESLDPTRATLGNAVFATSGSARDAAAAPDTAASSLSLATLPHAEVVTTAPIATAATPTRSAKAASTTDDSRTTPDPER